MHETLLWIMDKSEDILYNEKENGEYLIKVNMYRRARRRWVIYTFIIISLFSFTFVLRCILEPSFRPTQLVFWFFLILVVMVAIALIYRYLNILNESNLMLRPLFITNNAIYIPRVKKWEKIYFNEIEKIYWNPDLYYIVVLRDSIPLGFSKEDRGNINKLKNVLKNVVNFDENNDYSLAPKILRKLYKQ